MARGQQKIQAQQKNAEKLAKIKKQQGVDTRAFAKAALKITCPVCKTQMGDPKTYKSHFDSKHSKCDIPADLKAFMDEGKC